MANIMALKEGGKIITQGDKDTAAYLIKAGWLEFAAKEQMEARLQVCCKRLVSWACRAF